MPSHDFAQNHMALANHSPFNASSSPLRLPLSVLDAVFPGSSFLASFLLGFGIDTSLFVSWTAIVAAVWTAFRFGLAPACEFVVKALSSSVIVEEYDPIYNHVLNWASAQKYLQDIRSLRAQTAGQYYEAFGDDIQEDTHQLHLRESMSEDTIFNFNNWSARAPPSYRPHSSSGWFLHNHHLFRLYRSHERVSSDFSGLVYERERLDISVLWLSPKPIKKLIEEAREFHLIRRTSTTTIKRPTPKAQRGGGRHQAWTTIANRPSRSMATVVLDNDQKANILRDFNDFLHPRTARWYSNRGIPYRRGYLFHGPPGTGKTSLSFALAGVFGLDIYCLALSEATLTEEDLILLFNSLPKRCILLLEDIDTAGLGRAPGTKDAGKNESKKRSSPRKSKQKKKDAVAHEEDEEDQGPVNLKLQTVDIPTAVAKEPTFKNTITFSGLLNAIDGVASQEGRVLIMTTNYPERLDQALTRPGRVDLTIKFDLANRQQVKDLFMRMYCIDTVEMTRQPTKISHILPRKEREDLDTRALNVGGNDGNEDDSHHEHMAELTPTTICQLAEKFTNALPERTFSPAEIQGFLLVRKKDPVQALADVPGWRDEHLQKKVETGAKDNGNEAFHMKEMDAITGKRSAALKGGNVPDQSNEGGKEKENGCMQPTNEAERKRVAKAKPPGRTLTKMTEALTVTRTNDASARDGNETTTTMEQEPTDAQLNGSASSKNGTHNLSSAAQPDQAKVDAASATYPLSAGSSTANASTAPATQSETGPGAKIPDDLPAEVIDDMEERNGVDKQDEAIPNADSDLSSNSENGRDNDDDSSDNGSMCINGYDDYDNQESENDDDDDERVLMRQSWLRGRSGSARLPYGYRQGYAGGEHDS